MSTSSSSTYNKILQKYLPFPQAKRKFKRQCLKSKNILQENQSIQIGCKIQKFYDFYTSKNYVQVNIFIGNKLKKPIENYSIQFKGTNNLEVYVEERQEKYIKENTQGKERLIIEWNPQAEQTGDMLLLMSFSSQILTVKDTAIPLTLLSFLYFPQNLEKLFPSPTSLQYLYKLFKQKYELIEDQQFILNQSIFKKGYNSKDMQKFLDRMIKIQEPNSQNKNSEASQSQITFVGVCTIKDLTQQVGIIITVIDQSKKSSNQPILIKIILAGNQYKYFEPIFDNFKFLFVY